MDDIVVRGLVAVGVVVLAVVVARLSRPYQRPTHPRVDLRGTSLPTGIVVFTSSDCANCADVRSALKQSGATYREVTWELEAAVFAEAGVESVPLVVARDAAGVTIGQLSGLPRARALRSLVASVSGPSVADS